MFYDVLAKLLLGLVALVLFWNGYVAVRLGLGFGGPSISKLMAIPVSLLIPSVAVGCWATGLLLTYFGEKIKQEEANIQLSSPQGAAVLRELQTTREAGFLGAAFTPDSDGLFDREQVESIYQLLQGYLKDRTPEWRSVLTKNQAQVAFYEKVTAAMFILALVAFALTLLVCFDNGIVSEAYWDKVGYLATIAIPWVLFLLLSIARMRPKIRHLWKRQLAMFQTDMVNKGTPTLSTTAELVGPRKKEVSAASVDGKQVLMKKSDYVS